MLLVVVLALGASGGAGNAAANGVAAAATGPSLELAKTADSGTVDAGSPIGFRVDLTNHGPPPTYGRVIIEKRVDPNWAGRLLSVSFSGALGPFTLLGGTDQIRTFKAVQPGTYTVSENTPPSGFSLTGLICDDRDDGSDLGDDSTVDLATRTATIRLEAGETVRCTYTNHSDYGRVIIEKRFDPNSAGRLLSVSFGGALGPFTLVGGTDQIRTFKAVQPGTYTVSENTPSGFSLSGLTCDDRDDGSDLGDNSNVDLATRTATIRLEADETVRCTYTNTDSTAAPNGRGVVIIESQAPADQDSALELDLFGTFSENLACGGNNNISAGGERVCIDEAPGTYTVTESALSTNGRFVSLRCDDTNSSVDPATRTATIHLEADETVRCTWVNEDRRGWMIIEKQAPAGQASAPELDLFGTFSENLACGGNNNISAGGERVCIDEAPGTYTVTESALSTDGRFVSLRCDDTNSSVDPATRTATIHLEADETVRCTWVNETAPAPGAATNVVLTDSLPVKPGVSWSVDPAVDGCSIQAELLTCSFASLADGEKVSMHVTSPTTMASCGRYDNIAAASGDNRLRVETSAFLTVVCPGSIVVSKQTSPSGSTQSFSFTATYEPAGFSLADGQSHTSAPLAPGSYSVSESALSGWDTSASCSDGSPVSRISLSAGETVTCTFTNTKRGSVTLKKTTNGVVDPSKDISFVLTGPGLPSGGVSRSTFGDQDGVLDFGSANLIPSQTYRICEALVPAGFTSFWTLDGVIVTPYNPDASKSPPEDLGTRCYDFQVSPGQARAFEVDNSRPGGDPRTIGYWKNWNRCTSGNQAATAQKNGGAAAGFFLVEDLLPQRIGDFDVTTCQQAVKLLSKQDQNGKSKSSDAAYELASQLLAARFNLAAGAETCAAVKQAVLDGQTLLDQINFTGSGDYLGSKSKDARRTQALSLAATLDRYNNGNVC